MGQAMLFDTDITALQKLLGTDSITMSICKWNEARYDQVLNHLLTFSLLREEIAETLDAYSKTDRVGIIDGYADIFFVAIGALWKTGLSANHIDQLMDFVEKGNQFIPAPQVALMWWEDEVENHILAMVALAALKRLEYLLGDEQFALDAIRAVCISNNTKSVKKTAAHVKANIDKGDNYVAPTAALEDILRRSDEHVNK